MSVVPPTFFDSASAFRSWLQRHHAAQQELWVGFYKKGSGKGGLTYREALDEALCFGWIDGRLQSIDGDCYQQRFTPRRKGSHWSAVNIARVGELTAQGRMRPAGLAAFDTRRLQPAPYSHENRDQPMALAGDYAKAFRQNRRAWAFFEAQPPWYRRNTQWWVMSAKRQETRARRLAALIDASAAGERLGQFTLERPAKKA